MSVQRTIENALLCAMKAQKVVEATAIYSELEGRYQAKYAAQAEALNTTRIIETFARFEKELTVKTDRPGIILSGPVGLSLFESWLRQELYYIKKAVATEAAQEIRTLCGDHLKITDEDVIADFMG